MSKKANPTVIGFFVLGFLGLAICTVLVFGGGWLVRDTERYVLYFQGSVKGLRAGSPVKFKGVEIGSVTEVQVVLRLSDLTASVPVTIEIDRGQVLTQGDTTELLAVFEREQSWDPLEVLVRRGLRARLALESMVTGQLSVELDFFPGSGIVLVGGESGLRELPTIPSTLEEITRTLDSIPFDEVVQKAISSLNAVERLVNAPELMSTMRELEATVKDTGELTRTATAELKRIGSRLDEVLDSGGKLIRKVDDQVVPTAESSRLALSKIQDTLEKANALLVSLRRETGEGSALQTEAVRALRELSAAARSVRILSESLERRPESLLRGKGASGGSP